RQFAIPTYYYEFDATKDIRRDVTLSQYNVEKDAATSSVNTKMPQTSIKLANGKFRKSWTSFSGTVTGTYGVNWPIIRYADVLLMYAEALNEAGRTADAQAPATDRNTGGPLNRVRKRAGLDNVTGLSQSALRARIRKERRLELAFEGSQWFDILRYDNGAYFVPYLHAIGKTNATTKHMLLPIPQKEIDGNKNLVQNPGY
ncbi:MAG: RagB/SusD family nutrient uptake outer membrane protein, partial [Sphingobacteriales bacterium]